AGACGVLAAAAASCSLIVQTDSDQCKAASDCKGFAGLRACTDGVCQLTSTPPACMKEADCVTYADAVCTSGVCVRASCSKDDDCGADGVTCSGGTCTPGGTTTKECTSSMDCTGKGPYFVCRKDKCVSLVNDLCTTVYTTKKNDKDAYLDDNAVFFGS